MLFVKFYTSILFQVSIFFCYLFSLSKVAAEKMVNGNPYITDLSDGNRPMKLTEKFNSLYDNYWTDAYEILALNNTDERTICQQLLFIMQVCRLDTKHFIFRSPPFPCGNQKYPSLTTCHCHHLPTLKLFW